jgi:hypothetical protein
MRRLIPSKAQLAPLMMQAFQQQPPQAMPLLRDPETAKASLYGRMFDRFTPQADNSQYPLEDEQKKRLFRQGLLQFGVAALQPNGGNTGAAIARGLLAGTQGMGDGSRQLIQDSYNADKMRQAQIEDVPSGYREFDLTAKAGGLTDEQRRQAARVKLGLDGRASSAGYSFDTMKGADGRERIIRRNPRDASVEIYDETVRDFVPMGGEQVASAAPIGQEMPLQADYGPAETDNYVRKIMGNVGALDPNMPPEQMAQAILPHLIQQESAGNPNAVSPKGARGLTQVMPATGLDPGFGVAPLRDNSPQENVRFGRDYLTAMLKRYPGRPDLALAAYNAGPGVADKAASRRTASPNMAVGRSPEEEAAAVQDAKSAVDLRYKPLMNAADVQSAIDKRRGEAAADVGITQDKRTRDSTESLRDMADAEKLLARATGGLAGSAADKVAAVFGMTTDGRKATAALNIISARLVSKVPRFEGPQSNIDVQMYKDAAGNLADDTKTVGERMAALRQMQRIAKSYTAQSNKSQSNADDDALINKYLGR